MERVREDFDRIARLIAEEPERPDPYDGFVLSRIPASCRRLLEVGCGAGRLARTAAARGIEVTALDASPQMIALARRRASGASNPNFVCADLMQHPLETGAFEAVLAVATVHHLEPGPALSRLKVLVAPGGVLVLHDLRAFSGFADRLASGVAAVLNGDAWRWLAGRHRQSRELREAWHDHGRAERYPTLEEVRALRDLHLPGAVLHRHPLSRYTAVWSRSW